MTREEMLVAVEKALDKSLPPKKTKTPKGFAEAMRYAVGTGGKRIRPLVCLGACQAAGGDCNNALLPAVAIELLHNYTLVHDDLPEMDNDEERRGQPSVWKKYGHSTAVLVGDALQALAFQAAILSPVNQAMITALLSTAAQGVVYGQVEDLRRAANLKVDLDFIYNHKTADLFLAAAVMGGYAAEADEKARESLMIYGCTLGLAFQYQDDLLDGDSPYDRKELRKRVREMTRIAIGALKGLKGDTTFLKELAKSLVNRKV